MASSPGPSCGQTWSNAVLQVLLTISALTCVVIVQRKWQPQQGHHWGYWLTALRRILHIPLHKHIFSTLKELMCTDMASQIAAEMVSPPGSLPDLCCLYASKNLLPNSPQWTNCS